MSKHDIPFITIILFLTAIGMSTPLYATDWHERIGSSTMKQKSLSNAMVSAHFECNRDGLWANLDTLEVLDTYIEKYTITGGRKKITEYKTRVRFECTQNYQKGPTEEVQ